MNKYLKNEQGYTLVIVLIVLVLFTVIGAGLITLNLNNSMKNASREDNTQAQDLSVKGIDFVVREIETKVKTIASATNGLTPDQFSQQFNTILNSYKCENATYNLTTSLTASTPQTGDATYCIEKIDDTEKPLMKKVTFKSIGSTENKEVESKATYLLGSAADNNSGYALLTYGNDKVEPKPEDTIGNIEVHGGVQIKGNIFADNTFITSNTSRFKGTVVPSVSPIFVSSQSNGVTFTNRVEQRSSTLINKLAVPNDNNLSAALTKIGDPDFNNVNAIEYNLYNNGTSLVPITPMTVTHTNQVNFKIDELLTAKRNEFYNNNGNFKNSVHKLKTYYAGSDFLNIGTIPWTFNNYALINKTESVYGPLGGWLGLKHTSANVRNLNSTNSHVYPLGYKAGALYTDVDNFDWELYGDNVLKNVAFPKNLSLKYGAKSVANSSLNADATTIENIEYDDENNVEVKPIVDNLSTDPRLTVNTAYIAENMYVGLNNKTESNIGLLNNMLDLDVLGLTKGLESFVNFDTPVILNGIYYVNGNLTINSAQLVGNATFIVGGETSIMFADVGVNPNNPSNLNSLNIISKGPVKIGYLGNNHNNNDNLKIPGKFVHDVHASKWLGHIHSDTKITIEGATSNIIFNGSMSSKEIEITSIRGRTVPSCRAIGDYTKEYVIDGVLGNLLKPLLGSSLVDGLFATLFGDSQEGHSYNLVLDKRGTKYASNCFEKVAGQKAQTVKVPTFLIKALAIQLVGTGSENQTVTPRVQINYDPAPINYLKQKFGIQYQTSSVITQLDPPVLESRQ